MVRRYIMLSRKKRRNERFYEQQVSSLFFYQEVFVFLSPNPFQSFPLSLSDFPLLLSPIYAYQNVFFFFSVLSLFATAGYLLVTPSLSFPTPTPFIIFLVESLFVDTLPLPLLPSPLTLP